MDNYQVIYENNVVYINDVLKVTEDDNIIRFYTAGNKTPIATVNMDNIICYRIFEKRNK